MNLKNKTVLFLGSSVTYGSAAGGVSFADFLGEKLSLRVIKEAVSGTCLGDVNDASYVARLKRVDPSTHVDLVVCQLSTNDARLGIGLETVAAAIRYIARYVDQTFACPLVFYTGTRYDSPAYGAMISLLYELQAECGFEILDLWNDPELCSVSPADYRRYMRDPVHPTLDGYRLWWTPKFIDFLNSL